MGNVAKMPKKFEYDSFLFEQEERRGDWYIYSQFDPEHKKLVGWEVVKPTVQKKERINTLPNGKTAVRLAGEYYPSKSCWGGSGFTCISLSEARAKADKMSEQENKKK